MVYSSSSNMSSFKGIPFLKWLNNLAAAISPVLKITRKFENGN